MSFLFFFAKNRDVNWVNCPWIHSKSQAPLLCFRSEVAEMVAGMEAVQRPGSEVEGWDEENLENMCFLGILISNQSRFASKFGVFLCP